MKAIEISKKGLITVETGFIHLGNAQLQESKDRSIAFLQSEIGDLPSIQYLLRFEPSTDIIPIDKPEAHNHQRDHAGQVLILTSLYLKRLQHRGSIVVTDTEIQALALASVYHDCMRENDGADANHGERAALAIESNLLNEFDNIPNDVRQLACRIIREHVPDDTIDMHPLSKIFKDMDNMLWIRTEDFDPQYLRREEALDMLPIAHALLLETEEVMKENKDGFRAALLAAVRLGIINS